MSIIVLLTIVCAITYTFEIIFGLAGTIMMLIVMGIVLDYKTLVIYSILPQILVGVIGLTRSPKTVDIKFLAGMVTFASVGALLGIYLFYSFSTEVFRVLLAGMITISGIYLITASGKIRFNKVMTRTLDAVAGTSQALFGISGPIAMARLMGTFRDKTVIRNYALAFFLFLNLARMIGYLYNNSINGYILELMLYSAPVLIIVLWFSNHLHLKVNEVIFKKTVSWVIFVGGLSMFFHH